jgi:hypothetical protein
MLVPGGSPIAHHVHTHLAGSAAGIDLFGRSAAGLLDPDAATLVRDIQEELLDERRRLRRMADGYTIGFGPCAGKILPALDDPYKR